MWRWNRAIYDPADGGHVRIELRALPAGPTVADMCANAAFALGLTLALAADTDTWVRRVAFQQAHHNFYRAAQLGLRAELAWPLGAGGRVVTIPAAQLIQRLLPLAHQGLQDAGVDPEEAGSLLAVIGARAATGQTGAVWQRRTSPPWNHSWAASRRWPPCWNATWTTSGPATRPHLGDPSGPELQLSGRPSRDCYRRRAANGSGGWPPRPGPGRRPPPPHPPAP